MQSPTRGLPIATALKAVIVPFALSRGAVLLVAFAIGQAVAATLFFTWRPLV